MKSCFAFVLALVFLSGLVYSQSKSTGAIEGKVVDSEGGALPGVEIKLSSPDMIGGAQNKITDAAGRFRFVGLLPGVYTVEASLAGFATVKRENVRLHMRQTLTADIELKIATIEEEITVIAISPLIDVKDSAIGDTRFDKDFLDNIPNASRRISYMINQAPGVWGNQGYGGAGRYGNTYTIDGVETAWTKSGLDWAMLDFNIFAELEVMGLGASSEYDGFSGIATNSITKSGGNKFEGHIEFVYTDLGWRADNFDPSEEMFSLFETPTRRREIDGGFSIGGPFSKDRLWFFTAFRWRRSQWEVGGMDEIASVEKPTFFAKLTWQPKSKFRLSAFFEHDVYYNKNTGLGIRRPPICSWVEDGWCNLYSLNGLYSFTDKTFLEVRLFADQVPYWDECKGGLDTPGRIDDLTGMRSVNAEDYYDSYTARYVLSSTLSHHADEFIKGSHDFKFGIDLEAAPAWDNFWYPGGYNYRDNVWDGTEYVTYAYSYDYFTEQTFFQVSAFAQDSWKISDNFVINPGVRLNWYKAWLSHVGILSHRGWAGSPVPEEPAFQAMVFVPRLGFTWDIFGDHTTALKAHYGRYASSMKHDYYTEAATGVSDWVKYKIMPDGSKMETDRYNYSNPATIDTNIKYPVMDQITAGIERELMKDMSLGVTFIWRKWKNMIYNVNIGATWAPYTYAFTDENGNAQTIDIYTRTSPSSDDKYYITNPKKGEYSAIETPRATYWGLVFKLTKRFSNNWMLNASYTWSRLMGTQQGGNSRWSTWKEPNRQINVYGHLGRDPTHMFKVYSTFILPLDIMISPTFQYITGNHWERYVRASGISGYTSIDIEPQGTQRYPPFINFDVRIEKMFRFGNDRIGIQFDIFNILNRGVETGVESRVTRESFGLATGVNSGRTLRVGIRFLY